jgi:hypothetical protein
MHFLDWLYHIIPKIKEEELIQIGALTYGIWDARNQFIFENIDMSENTIIQKVMQNTSDIIVKLGFRIRKGVINLILR